MSKRVSWPSSASPRRPRRWRPGPSSARRGSRLTHEGWACSRGRLLTADGLRWVDGLRLDPLVRAQIEAMLAIMRALHEQLDQVDVELRRYAKTDRRIKALCRLFGIGPIIA